MVTEIGPADENTRKALSDALTLGKSYWVAPHSLLKESIFEIGFDTIPDDKGLKEFAHITGKVEALHNGKPLQHEFIGEASYLTKEKKAALSITYQTNDGNVVSLSGVLNVSNAQKPTLELLEVNSQGITDIGAIYTANRMTNHTFLPNTSIHK